MIVTHNDFQDANYRTDFSFNLSLEAPGYASYMPSKMQGLYGVPLELVADNFTCPTDPRRVRGRDKNGPLLDRHL